MLQPIGSQELDPTERLNNNMIIDVAPFFFSLLSGKYFGH